MPHRSPAASMSTNALRAPQPSPKRRRGRKPAPDPERHLRVVLLLSASRVPRAEQPDAVRAATPPQLHHLVRELARQHPLEIDPPLRVVIALAPQHEDSDTPAEIVHDHLRIALLLLIMPPKCVWDLTNRPRAYDSPLQKHEI